MSCYLFRVLVAMALSLSVSPAQAQICIIYEAETMPQDSGYVDRAPACGERILGQGILRIIDMTPGEMCGWYEQFQPFLASQDGVFEARMKVNDSSGFEAVQFGFSDESEKGFIIRATPEAIKLGLDDTLALETTVFHTYRIVKRGSLDVSFYVDGTEVLNLPYNANFFWWPASRQGFGSGSIGGSRDIEFDYVRFVIGAVDFNPPEMLRADNKADLPGAADRRFPCVKLPWLDPDEPLINPLLSPRLFYGLEPLAGPIFLTKSGETIRVTQ